MIKILLFVLGLFCFETLPAQTSSHKEAVNYYVKITNNAKESYLMMSKFAKIINDYAGFLNPNQKQMLEKNRIDSLQSEYELSVATIYRLKDSLRILNEIDSSINYKQHIMNSYDVIATAIKTIMPKFIDILKKDFAELSKEEILGFKELFVQTMATTFEKLNSLDEVDNTFKEKYSITNDELTANGL